MTETNTLIIGLVLGAAALILALVCGWQFHRLSVTKMICRELRSQQLSSEEVFKHLLRLLMRDGIDVNKYLTAIAQQRKEEDINGH